MSTGFASLRVSYLGGGYDFPKFFEHAPVRIIAEALPIRVECCVTDTSVEWCLPENLGTGLGSSAAQHLSFIRAKFPHAPWRDQIDAAIQLDTLQAGGWQDVIASAYDGVIKIVMHRKDWSVYPLVDVNLVLHPYRRLYPIPVELKSRNILINMRCRESCQAAMQSLVHKGIEALLAFDIAVFGKTVTKAWELKKSWHPEISNAAIARMEATAQKAGAWGYKVCGAGGQGYFLVLGDKTCHEQLREQWTCFEMDPEH